MSDKQTDIYNQLYPDIVTGTAQKLLVTAPLLGMPTTEIALMLQHIITQVMMGIVPMGQEQNFLQILSENVLDMLSVIREQQARKQP